MPRKTNRRARGKSRPQNLALRDSPRSEAFSLISAATGSTSYVVGIAPATLGNRIAAIADDFELYRVVSMRYRLIPSLPALTGPCAACYLPGVTDTSLTTLVAVGVIPNHTVLGPSQTVPSAWVKLPKQALASYSTWYKTIAGTPDPSVEVQGNVYIVSGLTTAGITLELEGIIQFRAPADPGSTPQMRREKVLLAEYTKIMKILADGAAVAGRSSSSSVTQKTL